MYASKTLHVEFTGAAEEGGLGALLLRLAETQDEDTGCGTFHKRSANVPLC